MNIAMLPPAGAALILLSTPAYAHVGHVGELAGHSHWIGWAALGAAAAIAVGASVLGKKREADKDTEASDTSEADAAADDTPAKA